MSIHPGEVVKVVVNPVVCLFRGHVWHEYAVPWVDRARQREIRHDGKRRRCRRCLRDESLCRQCQKDEPK